MTSLMLYGELKRSYALILIYYFYVVIKRMSFYRSCRLFCLSNFDLEKHSGLVR